MTTYTVWYTHCISTYYAHDSVSRISVIALFQHYSPTVTSPIPVPLIVSCSSSRFVAWSRLSMGTYFLLFLTVNALITKDYKRTRSKETTECKYINAWKTHADIQLRTSAELCTEHSKGLDYSTLGRTKRSVEKSGLAESRMQRCAKPILMQISQ